MCAPMNKYILHGHLKTQGLITVYIPIFLLHLRSVMLH